MNWTLPAIDLSFTNMADRVQRLHGSVSALEAMFPQAVGGSHVEFEDGFKRPRNFSSEYVHYYTNYRIIISHADVDDIQARYEDLLVAGLFDKHKHEFLYLVSMLETRLRVLVDPPPFNIVSLGRDCLSRSVPTKWGLKKPRPLGELTMPFDLSVHPLSCMADILEAGFADYLLPDRLQFDSLRNYVVDDSRQILWNHEVGRQWCDNGFTPFIARYQRRIENFYKTIRGGKPTVFVLYNNEPYDDVALASVRRIATAIGNITVDPIALCCITSTDQAEHKKAEQHWHTETVGRVPVSCFSIPVPYVWYLWFEHKHFTLPPGVVFETEVIRSIAETAAYLG